MKKVLFIYYSFPPVSGTGLWRSLQSVKYLPNFGWQPIVISADESVSYVKDYSLLKEIPEKIEVHRVGHRESKWKEWQYARRKLRIGFDFPDVFKSWYFPALREARKVLQKEKIDLIYSVSEPYTSHFTAMKLKKEFNIPWLAEFGDAWSGNDYLNLHYDKTLIKPLRKLQKLRIRRGERDIVKSADKTVVIHWHHKQQLCELYASEKEKIEIITDGYDESDFKGLKARPLYPDRLTIVFTGSIYLGYQEILLKFLRVINEVDKDTEVMFIGRGAEGMQGINTSNLTRILHLPKEKALALASGGDFFLLITLPSAKWHTPSKIYEYLRLGKPIFALVPKDGDAARIIRQAKAGFILSYEPERMREQLKVIFERWKRGEFKDFHPDWEYIAQFERRKLTEKLVRVFEEVSSK